MSLSFLPTLIHTWTNWFCWWDGEGQWFWHCQWNKLKFEQMSRKDVWGNLPGILQFQSTSTKVCLSERREHDFSFSPAISPIRADAAELAVGRTKPATAGQSRLQGHWNGHKNSFAIHNIGVWGSRDCWWFSLCFTNKGKGASARGDIYLTHPSPLSACYNTTLLQRSIWKIQRMVWLRRDWWESSEGSPTWAHKALFVWDQRETKIMLVKSMHKEIKAEASFSLEKWLSSRASLKERDIYTLSDLSARLKKSRGIALPHTQKYCSAISHCHDVICIYVFCLLFYRRQISWQLIFWFTYRKADVKMSFLPIFPLGRRWLIAKCYLIGITLLSRGSW